MSADDEGYTEEASDAALVRRGDGRRFKNLCRKLRDDIGGTLNVGQKWLVRRCVQITLELEKLEQAHNRGKEIDLVLFGQLTDRLGRTFAKVRARARQGDSGCRHRLHRVGVRAF